MKTRVRSASVFVTCFRVFGCPGGTRARVVHTTSQMSWDDDDFYVVCCVGRVEDSRQTSKRL